MRLSYTFKNKLMSYRTRLYICEQTSVLLDSLIPLWTSWRFVELAYKLRIHPLANKHFDSGRNATGDESAIPLLHNVR